EVFDKAQEEIAKVLAVNPQSTEAISLLASIDFLRETKDVDTFIKSNQNVQKVLKINPSYSKLFDTLAENCVSLRLYKQATEFARKALLVNPKDWKAMSTLGVNLMRIGEEDEGKGAVEKAEAG